LSNGPEINPNPQITPEEMTGADITMPLAWLAGRMVDSLVVNGSRLVSVDHRFEEQDGMLHVICSDEEGSSHMFQYDPTDRSDPVRHLVLGKHKED
jgi:hypothetical protein